MLPLKFTGALEELYNAHVNAHTQTVMMATPCAGTDVASNPSLCGYVSQVTNVQAAAKSAFAELSSEDKQEFAGLLAAVWID